MSSKKKSGKKSNGGPFVALVAVGILGLGGLAAYVKYGGASKVPPEVRRVEPIRSSSSNTNGKNDSVELVTPTRDGTDLKLDKHTSDVPPGEDARVFALNHFLRESKIVPDDARVLGVQLKDRVALVDVSPSFNQTYGSFDEEALLKGLCASLAQFPDIDKVQFFVDGKTVETLGNVDLTEPIPVRESPTSAN